MVFLCAFFSDGFKRLNQLSEERAKAENEHNAPRPGVGAPPKLQFAPGVLEREKEQERKDAIRGAHYQSWASYSGMMIEAEFRGLANGKVTLVKRDGSKVLTPFDDLFVEDQERIAKELEQNAAVEKAKAEKRAAVEKAKWRTWTDSTGTKFEAKFGGIGFGKVRLVNRDGSKTTIPLEDLSDEDRAWIEKRKH